MRETARRAFIAAVVFVAVVAIALALWKLKVLIALLFLAFIIAASGLRSSWLIIASIASLCWFI